MKLCYHCNTVQPNLSTMYCSCGRPYQPRRPYISPRQVKTWRLERNKVKAKGYVIPVWRREWNEYFMSILGMPWTDAGYELSQVVDTRRLGRQMFKTYDDERTNKNVPPAMIEGFVAEHRIRIENDEAKIKEMGFHPNKIPGGIADKLLRKAV